ncbi:MAG: class I SAM-dependent methyltransferase [Gemmatimonadota bacterium]
MSGCLCEATDHHFTPARARQDLATYRRRGPTGTARVILQSLRELDLRPETMLDIGAGVGVLHHELLQRGAGQAVHLEAAGAFVEVAKEETARRGHQGRVSFLHGDAVGMTAELAAADLVALDRVVCCYPEFAALLNVSTAKARRYFALSYPHDRWYVRSHTWWKNAQRRRAGDRFRTFVHPVAAIRALVAAAGFEVRCSRSTLVWEVLICARRDVA